jgi:hypothetical protein
MEKISVIVAQATLKQLSSLANSEDDINNFELVMKFILQQKELSKQNQTTVDRFDGGYSFNNYLNNLSR